jgi:hypothetical protein
MPKRYTSGTIAVVLKIRVTSDNKTVSCANSALSVWVSASPRIQQRLASVRSLADRTFCRSKSDKHGRRSLA